MCLRMLYSELGKTGVQISLLGFGAMRLPMMEKNDKSIVNEEESVKLSIELSSSV